MNLPVFRNIILMMAVLVSAACQQPHTATSARSSAASSPELDAAINTAIESAAEDDGVVGGRFHAEVVSILKQITLRLVDLCAEAPAQVDSCFRTHIVAAFDDSGEATKYCSPSAALDEYIDCVVIGNYAIDSLKRLGSTKMPMASDWEDPKKSMNRLLAGAVIDATTSCLEANADSIQACQEDELRKDLHLPQDLLAVCGTGKFDFNKAACFGEASSVRFLREHAGRV